MAGCCVLLVELVATTVGTWTTLTCGWAADARKTQLGDDVLPSGFRMEKMGVLVGRAGTGVRERYWGAELGVMISAAFARTAFAYTAADFFTCWRAFSAKVFPAGV